LPVSKDPGKAAIQKANLRQYAAMTHGAHSPEQIRPLRERFLAELAEAFPSASRHEIAIQAHRLAQLELLGLFLDEKGVIRHRRRGDVYPAASLAEKIASAYERQSAVLEQRERDRRDPAAVLDLASHWAQQDDGDGDG
jgi:hypothetical protein